FDPPRERSSQRGANPVGAGGELEDTSSGGGRNRRGVGGGIAAGLRTNSAAAGPQYTAARHGYPAQGLRGQDHRSRGATGEGGSRRSCRQGASRTGANGGNRGAADGRHRTSPGHGGVRRSGVTERF